jgi:hypothetical protein
LRPNALALLLALGSSVVHAQTTTFTVTPNATSAYRVNNVNNATLTLERGTTYTFNVNASGHPFYIKTARVTGTGSQYTKGVTGNGVTVGTLTFAVPMDAPNQLFYQCSVHSTMGGTLNITNPTPVPPEVPPVTAWIGPAIPNPSSRGAQIRCGLPRGGSVSLVIVDLFGRRARELRAGELPAGVHTFDWDGRDDRGSLVPSGLYLYQLKLGDRVLTGRLMIRR